MSIILLLHIGAMLGGMLLLLVGGLTGLAYLLQEHRLRSARLGRLSRRLPDLERLERYNRRTVVGGFVLLTLGIIIGAVMVAGYSRRAGLTLLDSRILATIAVWVICAALVAVSFLPRFRGRPVALLTLAAMVLIILMPVLAGLLWPTWHAFFGGGPAA